MRGTWRPAPPPAVNSKNIQNFEQPQAAKSKEQPLAQLYSDGNPTAEEQYLLELINRARANPDSEGIRLSNTNDPDVSNSYRQWGDPKRSQVLSDFQSYPSRPPLAFNADLITAARNHDHEMIKVDSQYHVGPDGDPGTRMAQAGYTGEMSWGENVFAYGDADPGGSSMFNINAEFEIDFGNPGMGHRHNLLNFDPTDPIFTEVGLGVIHGGNGYPDVGTIVTTEDFGERTQHFILGVAYSDRNSNHFYDIGEGDSGVKITVSSGTSYYAVTSGSGGYAIPYSGSGSVQVTASGGPFPTPVVKTVNLDGENVKVDFNPDLTGFPTQTTLVLPQLDTSVSTDSVNFTWNTVALAASYHIQIGTDSLLKKKLVDDSALAGIKDTTFRFGAFKDSTTYYWRVQAKNAKGLGPWSPIAAFSTAFVPSPVTLLAPSNGAIVPDTGVTFVWHQADKGGFDYNIEVTTDPALKKVVFPDYPSDTSEFVMPSVFQAGQTYYWTVLAQNDNGWSKAAAPRSFSISSAGITAPKAGALAVSLSPNPTHGEVHLGFTLTSPAPVTLRVFNSLGEQIREIPLGTMPSGANSYNFDGSSLAPGTYSLALRVGERFEMGRVVVLR